MENLCVNSLYTGKTGGKKTLIPSKLLNLVVRIHVNKTVLISIMGVSPARSSKAILSNEISHKYLRDCRRVLETDYHTHFHISCIPLPQLFQVPQLDLLSMP